MIRPRNLLIALLGLLLGAVPLSAQGQPTGTVAGRVLEDGSMRPLSGTVVRVADRSALSGSDGRYVIPNVPVGVHTVLATRIGYADATRDVTVVAGQTVSADLVMVSEAVQLGELVVIGYGERRARDVTGVVQTVTQEEFNRGRVVSAEELIQAKVAGVQIIQTGEPGGSVNVRIRGGTSINASNEPLFVIDGVPLPSGGGLSAGRNPLNFLNPEDIETITVLKDASATAIYGSRGANGVVIIQTRSGTVRDPQFTYSTSLSQSTNTRHPDMLTADQLRAAVNQYAPQLSPYMGTANTDWRGAVLRNARGQEHSLAVSGVGDNMNYRLSLGYLGQEGVLQGTMTERFSGSLNYNHALFENRLNVRANLRGARTDDQFTPGGGLGSATVFNPTQPIRTADGEFFEQRNFVLGPANPVAELTLGQIDGTTYRTLASIEGEYRMPFLEALRGTVRLGYDLATSERRTFMPTSLWSQQRTPNPGYVDRSNPRETTALLDAFLNYGSPFGPQGSNLDLTAGYSYETSQGDYPFFLARGLSTDMLNRYGIPAAAEVVPTLFVRENRLASFFGRANYSLYDRYLLTLSVRRDGSSRFGPGNQWGTFPAAAVAWRISGEPFMEGVETVSDLRLRASWGVNGNQAIGDYLWAPTYRYGDAFAQVQFGNEFVTTIRPGAFDPNIKWEETTSWNLGMDYGFLRNRFTGSVEYYLKDTDDLLFYVPVAAGTNLTNFVTTNIGSVRNQGVEFSLNARVFEAAPRGFSWTAGFNAARNRNELLRINRFGEATERIGVGPEISGGVGNQVQVLQPGFPAFSFFVHPADAGEGERRPFRNPAPDWILGHSSQFTFGNADLSFTLRSHLGNYVYNNLASSHGWYDLLNAAGGPVNLHSSVLTTGFEQPRFFSEVYLEDASFLKMDNLTLGYTLPRFRGAQQMRVFGTAQNLFTITDYSGIDPEAGLWGVDNNIYPRSRTLTIGASVGF
jgi:TonB-dependent starch-binding outer membrane protein SusC